MFYIVEIQETVGELEFKAHFSIQAKDAGEADAKADKIMQTWRSDSPVQMDEDGRYSFGEIDAEIMNINEYPRELVETLNDSGIVTRLACTL